MSYQVLARRWRPLTFGAVVGQDPIVRTLQNALARDRIAHAYLFTGPRGVGKTTTARLLAMGLACTPAAAGAAVPCAACEPCREVIAGRALDVIEIDGASNRGIDEVRTLRENARYAPARGRRKVYILDEVHMLTEPAFNALLKTLEEPPPHVVFILATTEPRRLPATILSRCQRFDFRPIRGAEIQAGLERILEEERAAGPPLPVEPEALALIARAADGSLRDGLSLLDTALAYGEGRVTAGAVRELLGSGGVEAAWGLAGALARRAAAEALRRIDQAAADGLDLGVLCRETMEVLRQALLGRIAGPAPDLPADEAERLAQIDAGGPEELLLLVKGLLDADADMRRSPQPRVDLEVAIVRLCQRPRPEAIDTLLERLERAEAQLRGFVPAGGPPGPVQGDLLGGPPVAGVPRPAVPAVASPRGAGPGGHPAGVPSRSPSPGPAAALLPAGAEATSPGAGGHTWPAIVAEVTRVRPTLGRMLADAVVVSEEAGRLTVALSNGNAFTQDQVRNPGNRQLLLDAARRLHPELRDVQFATGPTPAAAGVPVASHPRVQAIVEVFDGEVTAIRPLSAPAPRARGDGAGASPDGERVDEGIR